MAMKLQEAKNDYYRKRAKEEGYRSRAAFKILQLNKKYNLIRPGFKVVDIGCAPGGWLEVCSKLVGSRGLVVGVDIVHVSPVAPNVKILRDDVSSPRFVERLNEALGKGKSDCVLADLSPKLSGIWDMDHFRQIELCHKVVSLYPEILTIDGSAVLKAFHGDELQALISKLKSAFSRAEIVKPDASRKESSEVYLVGLGFTGRVPQEENGSHSEMHQSGPPLGSGEYDLQSDRLT
jgi:23S rRNA (uridine2552-2'-O)-methyltransferase